ncbi:DUF4097 domain-containing protein [Shewanella inventionis]|uniref:Adhesin domain-containing protein n=1 Tax=Shewanella inventionis TaxID=1738770 RepID=A0ABQ1J027_9GAMM|nr:hypothetical protein [Shewanella inventionis]MCL1159007.1 DUF4097 domain-containing protein [Shewanella inventionis]UAL43025.1 DUF4097 domain-containing protein [Shewanella inventionis]GGB56839.1 hypothetical protein GCM10011607_16770 [Shewanella inventionis]
MSVRIATVSVTVGLILGATLFGASQSEAESVFGVADSMLTDTDLTLTQQQLSLDASEITQLVANTGAGKLVIEGVDGLTQIKVSADIYTDKDADDVDMDLSLTQKGDKGFLVASIESDGFMQESPYIDLRVQVPSTLALDLTDGSGSIRIDDVSAAINLDDGSGSIVMNNIGELTLDDGSGSVVINHAKGNLVLKDGSGSITIDHVNGWVNLVDGSGSIHISQVQGQVTISDGSGSINVNNSKGLEVVNAGSGSVNYQDIDGPIVVK